MKEFERQVTVSLEDKFPGVFNVEDLFYLSGNSGIVVSVRNNRAQRYLVYGTNQVVKHEAFPSLQELGVNRHTWGNTTFDIEHENIMNWAKNLPL